MPRRNQDKYNSYVVYYINCLVNPNYFDWLEHQLKYLIEQTNDKNITELDKSKIFVMASFNPSDI